METEEFIRLVVEETKMTLGSRHMPPFGRKRMNWVNSLAERVVVWKDGECLPKEHRGNMGHCFSNALGLATLMGDGYCEGLATEGFSSKELVFHHGWVVGPCGKVFEATWPVAGLTYTGVEFSYEEVEKWQGRGPSRSMLWQSEVHYIVNLKAGRNLLEESLELESV